jgi:hypothetical protein
MTSGGKAAQETPAPSAKLTDQEWAKVQELPWDWDILRFQRLSTVPAALPGKVPGTVQDPLTQQAAERASRITDRELDDFIWQTRAAQAGGGTGSDALKAKLAAQVRELIAQPWQPLVFPPGKHPREAYRIFADPTETLFTLARAYPYVEANLQSSIRRYVETLNLASLQGGAGQRAVDPTAGAVRSFYDIAPAKLFRLRDDITRCDVARLYPLWLWASVTNDWQHLESEWGRLKALVDQTPNKMEEDCRNGYLAGLIAYCRIADHMKDEESRQKGLMVTRAALRERLAYEFAYTKGGLISEVPVSRTVFARWRHLTPEIGHFLAHYVGPTHQSLMNVYVDYHRPTWYLAWGVETLWRNEAPFAFPTMPAEIFAARAWILRESAEKLMGFLDLPWCRADLFYLQKLVLCLDAR